MWYNGSMKKGMFVLLALILVGGCVLLSNNVMADDSAVVTASITVPTACTMTGTGTTHAATLSPGTYSGASGNEYENLRFHREELMVVAKPIFQTYFLVHKDYTIPFLFQNILDLP